MGKAETCENCGRDLPNLEWCEHCGHDNYNYHLTGWSKKRILNETKAEQKERKSK